METLKLKAEIREKTGGLSSKKAIYDNKLVPGVVYGGKDAPVAIQVKNNELLKIINNEDKKVPYEVEKSLNKIKILIYEF